MKDGTEPFRTVFFVYLPIMRRRQFLKYAGAAGLAAALDPGQALARGTKESTVSLK
ncbi:MAG: twin-arginine translocation signal domain-containing protein, partial [Bacteroidales bacterium]|nr:twin-arginine translocation signal domain-containing protein [Bacteroidales bacterium]